MYDHNDTIVFVRAIISGGCDVGLALPKIPSAAAAGGGWVE